MLTWELEIQEIGIYNEDVRYIIDSIKEARVK